MDINKILSEEDIGYEKIKDFLENYNEENYNKILFKINKFTEDDMKIICKKIISNSKNKDIAEKACSEIITFVEFDYEYYREIVKIMSLKKFHGIWINEIIDDLIENDTRTIVDVFEDLGEDIPQNVIYDIQIVTKLLDIYNEKYIKELKVERYKIIKACKRINYIVSINVIDMLKMFYYFSIEYKLNSEEIKTFLDTFFLNYPSVCKKFIENEEEYDNDTEFINYLQSKILEYNKEENIKYGLEIFKPNSRRMIEYRKMQLKQNKKINKEAKKYSFLADVFKSNTILYGRKYGVAVSTKDSKKVSVNKLHEFKYEYPLPLEYVLDPVEYLKKVNELESIGKEK